MDDDTDITGPDEPTHEATTPPGENQADENKVKEAEEELDQAGGGH